MVVDVIFPLKKVFTLIQFQPAELEPRRVRPGEGEGTSHTLTWVIWAGCFWAPWALFPLALRLRLAPSGKSAASTELAPPCGLDALTPHKVVDGSFLTRR